MCLLRFFIGIIWWTPEPLSCTLNPGVFQTRLRFSIPYFRPDSQNVYPISDPVRYGNFSNSQWIYGVRDFVTPQMMFAFFSSRSMSTATHVTLKMVSQTKQTEYTPYFRPKWQSYTLCQTRKAWKWYRLGRHIPVWLIYGSTPLPFPPPPPPGTLKSRTELLESDLSAPCDNINMRNTNEHVWRNRLLSIGRDAYSCRPSSTDKPHKGYTLSKLTMGSKLR